MKTIKMIFILASMFILNPVDSSAGSHLEIGPAIKTPGTVVVPANGTDSENGAALISALEGIEVTQRVLIKLEPGVYDIGSEMLEMISYVDLEGSGKDITIIKGNISGCDFCDEYGVLRGANFSEVRNLTIKNVQQSVDGVPIAISNLAGNPKFTNVCVYAEAAAGADVEAVGILNIDAGNTYLTDVQIDVVRGTKSSGIKNIRTDPWLNNVTISVSPSIVESSEAYGIYNEDSAPWIRNSNIRTYQALGKSYAIYSVANSSSYDSVHVYWSELFGSGGISAEAAALYGDENQAFRIFGTIIDGADQVDGGGAFNCANCIDGFLNTLNSGCTTTP